MTTAHSLHSSPSRRASSGRSGFTLIELIAVMGIVIALALVVTSGYSGIARSIAQGQSTRQVRDSLLLARQTACVNGVEVYVYILDETQFIICRKIGTSSGSLGNASYQSGKDPLYHKDAKVYCDYYTDLSSFVSEIDTGSESAGQSDSSSLYKDSDLSGSMDLYDLSANELCAATLRGVEYNKDLGFGWLLYCKPRKGESSIPGSFLDEGHDYGVPIHPIRALPKGYVFLNKAGDFVSFSPTGEATPKEIKVAEYAQMDSGKHQFKIQVLQSGKIEIEEPK